MKRNMQYSLYALNFFSFFAISLVNTQLIPLLASVGYSVVQRGFILASNSIIAIMGQGIFGYLCDRFKKIKLFFFIAYSLLLVSSLFMFMKTEQAFYYHLLTVSISGGMVKVIMGLDETWMLKVDQEHYGKLRAWGALGLTLGAPLAGFLVKTWSYRSLMISLVITSIILFYFMFISKDAKGEEGEKVTLSNLKELLKNKNYLILVTIFLLIYMVGTADQYVVIDKMLDIGSSNEVVGVKWALQSFMEVPLFLFASKILAKYKPSKLLLFGTIMYGIKFMLYAYSFNGWLIVATASLQIVTLPIIMLTSKVFIKEVTPSSLYVSAQMFAMAIFIGVSGLITPIITSYLSAYIGYNNTLYAVAAFTIIPFLLIIYYLKTSENM